MVRRHNPDHHYFNVIMTRSDDTFVPLGKRAEIGNDANADLFISIHLNAASSTSANGSEVFYFSKKDSAYAAEVATFEMIRVNA